MLSSIEYDKKFYNFWPSVHSDQMAFEEILYSDELSMKTILGLM